jgi:hypothetical protein
MDIVVGMLQQMDKRVQAGGILESAHAHDMVLRHCPTEERGNARVGSFASSGLLCYTWTGKERA